MSQHLLAAIERVAVLQRSIIIKCISNMYSGTQHGDLTREVGCYRVTTLYMSRFHCSSNGLTSVENIHVTEWLEVN